MYKSPSDECYFEELYHENYNLVYRLIRHRLSYYGCSTADAADLTQEVFLFASNRIPALRKHPKPKGWLCKTAHYMAMNHIHTQAQHREQPFHSLDLQGATDDIAAVDLRASLESMLDERDYAILHAYCIERRPHEDICREYGFTESRLRVHIHRLRKFLLSNFILLVTISIRQYI